MAIKLPPVITYGIGYDNEPRPHKKIKGRVVRHGGAIYGIELRLTNESLYRGTLKIRGMLFLVTAIPLVPGTDNHFEAADDRATYELHNFVTYFEKQFFTPPERVRIDDLQCVLYILPKAKP